MVKIGYRKLNFKKSFSAKTTGRLTRSAKKITNPYYGKTGIGIITNPKKALYNSIYNKTTISIFDNKSSKRPSINPISSIAQYYLNTSFTNYNDSSFTSDIDADISLTQNKIKALQNTIENAKNTQRMIICLGTFVVILAILVFFLNNILITLLFLLYFLFSVIIVVIHGPSTFKTEELSTELEFLNKVLSKQIEMKQQQENKEEEIRKRIIYDIELKVKGIIYKEENFKKVCALLIAEHSLPPYMGYDYDEIKEELSYTKIFYKYPEIYTEEVEFIPEPDNKFDSNAIQIYVKGYHIGYVTKSKAQKISRLISNSNNTIIKVAKVYGGGYKFINENTNRINTVSGNFHIRIYLVVLKNA